MQGRNDFGPSLTAFEMQLNRHQCAHHEFENFPVADTGKLDSQSSGPEHSI